MKRVRVSVSLLAVFGLVACAGGDSAGDGAEPEAVEEITFGPVDGHDLPGTDLERVAAGDPAPDFTALALAGHPVTLSDFRGEKNVVLFFYRGHW